MNCPKCGARMKFDVVLEGGCSGHEGDYRCYCPNPDVHVDFVCVAKKRRGYCDHRVRVISDRYALERYLEKYYVKEK